MGKRNFLLSVLMIISSLLFAVPIDKEYAKSQIVLGETVGYNHGKIKKSVSVIDGNEGAKNLQLASALSLSSSEIEYKEGFSVSASIKNSATTAFTGDLGLALYDVNFELLTIIDVQDTTISAGGTIDCTFGTEGWSELIAGVYNAAIYSKTAGEEWKSIDGGSNSNMVQFRVKEIGGACSDNLIYTCDFESELLGWTFAKADGINTGFVVDTAMKCHGEKALYISSDGGKSMGYTLDNDKGYVSVAYKKLYLEEGSYQINFDFFQYLEYADIDIDIVRLAIVPATNEIEALNYYDIYPSFLYDAVFQSYFGDTYGNWSWGEWTDVNVDNSGSYYLLFIFIANDYDGGQKGWALDNLSIKRETKLEITYRETLDGVLFEWTGGYSKYRVDWYSWCSDYRYDTVDVNSYLLPYTELRKAVYENGIYAFDVDVICDDGQIGLHHGLWFTVNTEPFPLDTCPAVPTDIKAENTDYGVKVTWQGNTGLYDFKYGSDWTGCCDWYDTINGTRDTTYFIPYNSSYKLQENCDNYFFVRSICEKDTSIWRRVQLCVEGPKAQTSDVCHAKPYDFYAQNTNEGIMLTWKGNASKYEIECRSEDEYYRRGNIYDNNDSNYVRFIANDSIYTIPYDVLSDTLYHFRVRAICENDTSFWTDYISAYNINFGEYCIPFYDLCGPNTLCTFGGYYDPYSNKKTLDYRQKDWDESYEKWNDYGYRYGVYDWGGWNWSYYRSRHTICFEGEVDPRCDSLLTTVPPGEKYSIRLGNWYNGEGESVTYTHKIDSGYRLILLLKYAVVLQDPSHTSKENPHFTLEILDENGQLLDSECLYADFAADKNATGWNNAVNAHEPTKEEFRNVVWKDWTTIGVNLSDLSQYGDRVIKIRLTTKDCTRGQHYGYAYFTLQCTTGNMLGIKCAERPLFFEVAEGFKYRWYLMDDTTKTSVWDQRRFEVAELDTNSYHVDMISLENENCYYTMNAYTLPRMPESKAEYTLTPHDCLNEVSFVNKSEVYKIMLDGSHMLDSRVVIDSVIWDFGVYGTSLGDNPKIIVPNNGDTFKIKLRTVANGCYHVNEIEVKVPAIRDTITYANKRIYEGDTLWYCGKEYYYEGEYVDTFARNYGCDSIHILTIEYIETFRKPISLATFDVSPHDCQNEIFITNESNVYHYYTEDSVVLDLKTPIDSIFWDFGVYGTSTEVTPKLIIPNEGDTFTVKLRTVVGVFESVFEYELQVPAIGDVITYLYAEICKGSKYVYDGKEYEDEGEYIISQDTTIYGCDSTYMLAVSYVQPEVVEVIDSVCFADLPYEFYGEKLMQSGEYAHTIFAINGCDSITYKLNLFIRERLVVELNELAEICGDDANFVIPYTISQGGFSSGELHFNQFALNAGFENVVDFTRDEVVVTIPDSVRPDTYAVDVVFNNHGCETVTLPLEFTVLYPSSVIGQRWNDLLGVKNEHYNGGYTFTDYQWYLNGEPIEGYKATQIYEYGKELDFEGEYRVLLTRADDGKSIMSCPFTPVKYNEDEYTELSTLVYTNQVVVANASHAAEAKMYNVAGVCVGTYAFEVGYNDVKMPSEVGVYTMQVVYDSDKIQVIRIVVRK